MHTRSTRPRNVSKFRKHFDMIVEVLKLLLVIGLGIFAWILVYG